MALFQPTFLKTLLLYLAVYIECQILKSKCVYLNRACVDYSCYEKCGGISSQHPVRDLLKVCGNMTFFSCFMKYHIEEQAHCGKRYQQCVLVNGTSFKNSDESDSQSQNLKIEILLTSIISPVMLVTAVVCYCRVYMRSRLQAQKKFYSIELQGNDISTSEAEVRVSWIEPQIKTIAHKEQSESIWNNIYIRKLEDYETSEEEEDSNCDDDEEKSNSMCKDTA